MSKKEVKAKAEPFIAVTIDKVPGEEAYLGTVYKNGQVVFKTEHPTLYLAVAGQVRRFIDMGMSV